MPLFSRFRPRISLRLALCLVPVMGVLFGWIARHVQEHRVEQLAIAQLHASPPFNAAPAIPANRGINIQVFL